MIYLVVLTAAFAATECPWKGGVELDVSATMTTVEINGTDYFVKGRDNREDFSDILQACGFEDADEAFGKWRADRRRTNASGVIAGVGLLALWPLTVGGGIVAGINGAVAKKHRETMIDAIEDRE